MTRRLPAARHREKEKGASLKRKKVSGSSKPNCFVRIKEKLPKKYKSIPVGFSVANPVQLAVPIGDDGQLMSFGPPVL